MGGHFALADKAMMQFGARGEGQPERVRECPRAFRSPCEYRRGEEASAALKAAGPYSLDPKLVAEVAAMPKQAIDRASAREIKGFNEAFLRDFVQLMPDALGRCDRHGRRAAHLCRTDRVLAEVEARELPAELARRRWN